jgi:hypothetical protein
MKENITSLGYCQLNIINPRTKKKMVAVHRLVCFTWLGNPPKNKPEVNHIDGNKQNNHVKNLEWCSRSYNIQHGFDNHLFDKKVQDTIERNKRLWAEGKKQKMLDAAAFKKKNKHLFEFNSPIKVIQISTGKVFDSKYHACRYCNISIATMNLILKGTYSKIDYKFYTP